VIDLIKENIDQVQELCRKHQVKSLYVFGSACSDRFSEESDIDFLITFKAATIPLYKEDYFALSKAFRRIFNRKIDLITEKSLVNPFFTASVEQTRKLIYEA